LNDRVTLYKRNSVRERDQTLLLLSSIVRAPPEGFQLPERRRENLRSRKVQRGRSLTQLKRRNLNIDGTDDRQPCEDSARILLAAARRLLPAPREITPMAVRQRVVSPERSVVALRAVVAAGARDALGSPDGLLRGVQQAIQNLADRAVFAVERIGIHVRSSTQVLERGIWLPLALLLSLTGLERACSNCAGEPQRQLSLSTWHNLHTFHVIDRTENIARPEINDGHANWTGITELK